MKKFWTANSGIILLLISSMLFIAACNNTGSINAETVSNTETAGDIESINSAGTADNQNKPSQAVVKEFSINAFKFGFDPSTIEVNKGDTVRITLSSSDVGHGFALKEYGISETFSKGETKTVEFVADKEGTFTFYCNVYCGSGHGDMKGTLIVK
ncbi:MAG: cupredoxin domain-containing protein [Nanoarchaeota archaeon]|nr:cupredoxin domain-containing protein [Nanoarchaeota archaeon]